MKVSGAWSTSVRDVVTGDVRAADWLGVCRSALYLRTGPDEVLAVLTRDAYRLPCAVVLPTTAGQLPLTALARVDGSPATIGQGRIAWDGPAGPVTVDCTRQWAPARVPLTGPPLPQELTELRRAVAGRDLGIEPERVAALAAAGDRHRQARAAAALLGRGPGLTPSGDDVLAGFLLGARAFGRPSDGVERIVAVQASRATTALSAQLLRHAVRGECAGELAAVIGLLTGRGGAPDVLARLLAVGHTSGAALAQGLLAAEPDPGQELVSAVDGPRGGRHDHVHPSDLTPVGSLTAVGNRTAVGSLTASARR
jgi:hypothetical protein